MDNSVPGVPGVPALVQQLVGGAATSSDVAAQMLSEFASGRQAACSWDTFVSHNWLPVLSLALGPEWRSKYDSEVAAMIALQLSLQPGGGGSSGSGSSPSSGAGSDAAAAAAHAPTAAAAKAPQQPGQMAQCTGSDSTAIGAAAAAEAAASRAFAAEASVDVDGKRRRLRRKRAASPESPYRLPASEGGIREAVPGLEHPAAAGQLQLLPQLAGGPEPRGSLDSEPAPAAEGITQGGGGSQESGSALAAGSKGVLVQRVIRQVCKLNLNAGAGAATTCANPAEHGSVAADEAGSSSKGAPAGVTGAASSPVPAAPAAPAVPHASGGSREAPSSAAGAAAGQSRGDVAAAVSPELQRGLLDSLSLVHDLSQRIVTNLQEVIQARGLSLPEQMLAPTAAASAGPAPVDGGGKAGAGAAAGSGLPLSVLLGGSLVDRMDLLGRTALHVAAATGRADIVRQLAAAGASLSKALPMDYRTLMRQHSGTLAEAAAPRHAQAHGPRRDCDAGVDAAAAAVAGLTLEAGGPAGQPADGRDSASQQQQLFAEPASPGADAEPAAPPPKRGRYVTAGPPPIAAPSLQYCTALHLAALHGHLEVVAELLGTGGVDVNAKSIEGATPLHMAAYAGHAQVAARLCRTPGVLLNAADQQGRTPLHLAASRGHDAVVVELWARGATIDPCDLHGWTALHYAARAGHTEVSGKLVIAGAHVAAADPHGITAAHLAAERGFAGIVERLLLAGYVVDSVAGPLADGTEGGTALHLAAAQGHAEVAAQLLRSCADPRRLDFSARNALDLAVLHGHLALVPPLLEAGCWFTNGSDYDDCPAQPAAGDDAAPQLGLLRCLASPAPLQHPAFAELRDGTELVAESFRLSFAECAARAGRLEVLEQLEQRGLDLRGRTGSAVLAAAVHSGAAPLVRWLLGERTGGGRRCDVAAALEQEDLLHEAASRGDVEVLRALLGAAGTAALGRTDGRGLGRTPLHSAVIHRQAPAAELLIEAHLWGGGAVEGSPSTAPEPREQQQGQQEAGQQGCSAQPAPAVGLDAADSQGLTPLHWAALTGSSRVLRRLLAAGARREATAADGMTPLHLAAKAGHVAAVQALLEAGCSVTALDEHGCLPLHYIALRGDLALFVLLFSPSAPSLAARPAAGAALLTAAIRGGSSEMVGIVLLTGATTPQKCREAGQTPVHAAAREGCLDVLQYLYGAGFDMTELDSERKSPLHHAPIGCGQAALAARRGADHRAAAEVLLAAGCRVDAQDTHGCTPLHFAAGAGALGMLSRFIELAGSSGSGGCAAVNVPDSIGWTPLFWACNNGHAAAAERLLKEGASPWAKDCNQRLPLHFASEAGHTACVRLLVAEMRRQPAPQAPASTPAEGAATATPAPGPALLDLKDQNGQTPVQLAAEHGHPDCAALLLDMDGTAEAKRRNALHLAAQQGQLEIARQVIAARRLAVSAKDADGWLPIHYAAAAGHAELAAALLAAGSEVEEVAGDGDAPLHKAALGGHLAVVQLLKGRSQLDQRNSAGSTPLYNAASQGHPAHLAIMRELAEEGASVDAATTNGCTPLYIAANNGLADAAALLLELGASPDAETTSGCTPLHAAALNGHAAVVERLVAAGCDVDLQSQNGSSALHNAASGGHAAVVELLLAAKADCDVQNSNGNTPLHLAAGKGWIQVAELLAGAGADPHIRNSKGWLAIQSASNSGYFDVVLKLVQHGSPWRLKGDADVVKLLSKKSSYKPSYVEGRLRIAEKERQRRLAREAAQAQGGAAGAGGAAGSLASAGSEQDLVQAAAQADAVMAELLEEEEADKERAERLKAKKAAKKQQKAAKRQQQLEAAAAEQRQREEEEARRAAKEAERLQRQQQEVAAAAAQRRAEELLQQELEEVERQRRRQSQQGTAAALAGPSSLVDSAAEQPAGSDRPAGTTQQAQQKQNEPRERVQQQTAHSSEQSSAPAAACSGDAPAKQASKAGPASPPAAEGQPAAPAAPAMTPPRTAAKPQNVQPAAQGKPAGVATGSLANGAAAARPAVQAAAPPGKPLTRPAPWAGMAAARAAAPAAAAPATAVNAAQRGQQQQGALPAHNITRPAHFGGAAAPAPGPQLPPQHPLAPAASLGLALPRWSPPASAAAVQRQQGLQAPLLQQQLQAQQAQLLSSLAALPASQALHQRMLPSLPMQPPAVGPASMHQAVPLVAPAAATQAVPMAASSATAAAAAAGTLLSSSLGPPSALSRLAAAAAPAAQLSSSAPGFVPLFGLNLPTLSGLGVDWSMPTSTGPAGGAFGSPARQPPTPGYAPAPPGMAAQQPLSAALARAPAAAPHGPTAAGLVGSFSPSDASSIESSSEAEELFAGLHGLHASRPPSAGGVAAAAAALARTAALAATPTKLAMPAPPANAVASADADGIDDVLRLQPWLE